MHLRPITTAGTILLTAFLLLLSTITTTTNAHNITKILSKHPQYSSFNHYLSLTHLSSDINTRTTITVCALDNAAMAHLLSSNHPPITTLKTTLSLHILLDYFGAKKLHQITNGTALSATLFQTTGSAPASSGFVNITDLKAGKVSFAPQNNHATPSSFFVKSVQEIPYNISVIQISDVIPPSDVVSEAPSPSSATKRVNLTAVMSKHGCEAFADALAAAKEAERTYVDSLDGGLTVFCPVDGAFKGFLSKYRNLTAAGKTALLEFHGVPVYQPLATLKSNNGLLNTLATDGANKFDFTVQNEGEEVTLRTKITTAKIGDTLIDEEPLVIYAIDKVLLPRELFQSAALAPAPAPAPGTDAAADSPAQPRKKGKKAKAAPADSDAEEPADSPDDAADETADDNGAVGFDGGVSFVMVAAAASFLGSWSCEFCH